MDVTILVVESRPARGQRIADWLEKAGAKVERVTSAAQALERLSRPGIGAVVSPRWLPTMSGEGLLGLASSRNSKLLGALVDNPDQDRGLLENLVRQLAGIPTGA